MPPLPTSLSVVALVVAWLVVLVPMAARRREHVPDSDERSAGFRILRRSSRRRHQRVLSRTAIVSEADERNAGVDAMDEQTLWSEEDDLEPDEWDGPSEEVDDTAEMDEGSDVDDEGADGDLAESLLDEDDDLDDREGDLDDLVESGAFESRRVDETDLADEDDVEDALPADAVAPGPAADPRPADPRATRRPAAARSRTETEQWAADPGEFSDAGYADGYSTGFSDAADEWDAEHRNVDPRSAGAANAAAHAAAHPAGRVATPDLDPAALRPVPRRHGRGGFDPDAAAKARAYRYRRRRRVTLVLLFATIVFTLVSVFLSRPAWVGTALCAALLVGYLAYLRRQVRIEEAIRQRRTARLAQARQLRPDYSREAIRDPYRSDPRVREAEPAAAVPTGRVPGDDRSDRWSVPPSQYRSGTVVDLDDDDPAFSDLEHYQPLTYRRASGQ
jgi:hypothetical protein